VNETGMQKYRRDESVGQPVNHLSLSPIEYRNRPEPLIGIFVVEATKPTDVLDCANLSCGIRGVVQA
jgi:hypothetical protein